MNQVDTYPPHSDKANQYLTQKGYVVLKGLFPKELMETIYGDIKRYIHACATELNTSYETYLNVVSRWADPSPVTQGLRKRLTKAIEGVVTSFIGPCELAKLNVISKTPFAPAPVPFHQDISYSPQAPYQLSAWLAVTDVPDQAGPLEVWEGSHRGTIEPAVDFWHPHSKVAFPSGTYRKLPVNQGDVILFDSKLWHGSGVNKASWERFAVVTRWHSLHNKLPVIPEPIRKPFGMWTCRADTEKVLSSALNRLQGSLNNEPDFESILQKWITILEKAPPSFIPNPQKTLEALRGVTLLNRAHKQHNGGDAQGTIYKRLWESLLNPLTAHSRVS